MKTVSMTIALMELTGRPSMAGEAPTVIFSGRIMHRHFASLKPDAGARSSTSPIFAPNTAAELLTELTPHGRQPPEAEHKQPYRARSSPA